MVKKRRLFSPKGQRITHEVRIIFVESLGLTLKLQNATFLLCRLEEQVCQLVTS